MATKLVFTDHALYWLTYKLKVNEMTFFDRLSSVSLLTFQIFILFTTRIISIATKHYTNHSSNKGSHLFQGERIME